MPENFQKFQNFKKFQKFKKKKIEKENLPKRRSRSALANRDWGGDIGRKPRYTVPYFIVPRNQRDLGTGRAPRDR